MTHFLFKGNIPVVCERKDWKTCPEHKGLTDKMPKAYKKSNTVPIDDFIEETGFLSRERLTDTVISEDEFYDLSHKGDIKLKIGITAEEMIGADMDRLTAIFGDMVAGERYSRNDTVLFKRDGVVDGMHVFDVTYERNMSKLSYDDWEEEFKPKQNHIDSNASFNGNLFETFGKEVDYIENLAHSKDANKIWTLIEVDGELYVVNGYHHVNRLGYFVTANGTDVDVEITVDD